MDEPRDDIPELFLEQYLLGELAPARRARVEAFVATAQGAARLAELRASSEAVLAEHPPARVSADVSRTARLASAAAPAPRHRARLVVAVAALVCVVALGIGGWQLLGPAAPAGSDDAASTQGLDARTLARVDGERDDGLRAKGLAPRLVIYRRGQAGSAEAMVPGTVADPRDLLQISYVAAARPHGVVLSIDGRGVVTLHHPESASGATRLEASGETALGHAYELDDAPRFERFFLVTGTEPLDVDRIVQAARALAARDDAELAPLALPERLEQSSFLVRKPPLADGEEP